MKLEKEFVLREIAGDYVIIPVGKTVIEYPEQAFLNVGTIDQAIEKGKKLLAEIEQ